MEDILITVRITYGDPVMMSVAKVKGIMRALIEDNYGLFRYWNDDGQANFDCGAKVISIMNSDLDLFEEFVPKPKK